MPDRAGLTQFLADLRADLPASDSLTVCVEAFATLAQYRANGYDLPGLAASADQIVLMTYDDHGPWENTPGPIGPLRWQRASVRALERVVPPDRVYLGVADYGYAWRPHSNDNLSFAQARRLVARWHARSPAAWRSRKRSACTGSPSGRSAQATRSPPTKPTHTNENQLRDVQLHRARVGRCRSLMGNPIHKEVTMNISSVSHIPAATTPPALTTSNVSGAALKAATGDGDGRTGAAALNDGDAAAQAARRGAIDVKA